MTGIESKQLVDSVYQVLQHVTDPEIDSVSIIDLGMIEHVEMSGSAATVSVLPTFTGCPALDIIQRDIVNAVIEVDGVEEVEVIFPSKPIWTTDRITDQGKEQLKEFGISPPPANHTPGEPWEIPCPYCGSLYTTMENLFGPTACRCILYCRSCKNPFEAMKPVANIGDE
ncbi:1,2-phenylacetyl-CoA epoxidase subunit PaaD [Pseudalkalibacillus berkeleyi]|uniref:Phenylacetate-CoA oxygenase subunit PaaJ n=1 Tax=Pseudalkalibacillus berkeleyi TaxID=1069813 RepID=A0ABS9GTQ7_9BACL|nr:1,2-phenylacetyl-CoA epoxidase subunit PaaD [Pseudalkalibacillus berkeleyi]MCF6136228.1 phenylacetate-CoA oxygenase subunit PaaJ [Pseudalkalibacillus berkeleyi]